MGRAKPPFPSSIKSSSFSGIDWPFSYCGSSKRTWRTAAKSCESSRGSGPAVGAAWALWGVASAGGGAALGVASAAGGAALGAASAGAGAALGAAATGWGVASALASEKLGVAGGAAVAT